MDSEKKVIVCFKDRIEPLLEALEDNDEIFGLLMRAMFKYALYGETPENITDMFQKYAFSQLKEMIDRANEGNREFQVNQIIKSNLRYATSEEDMKNRLARKGLTDDEIDIGLDRYRRKQREDLGLTPEGQFPRGTAWEEMQRVRGY